MSEDTSSSQPSERPAWAEYRWFDGYAQVLPSSPQCAGKIMWSGTWFICEKMVHEASEPHQGGGWNHNLFWDDSGYWENRII